MSSGRSLFWLTQILSAFALVGCQSTEPFFNLVQEATSATKQPPQIAVQSTSTADMEAAVHRQINQVRQERGLKTLQVNSKAAKVARDYSRQMARGNFFSHTGLKGDNVGQRVNSAGLKYWMVGENLFKSTNISQPVPVAVQGWMKSPGHRENILERSYTQTGIGVWRVGTTYYFTQVFLLPR